MISDPRRTLRDLLLRAPADIAAAMSPDAAWHVAHPVGDLAGPAAVTERFLQPLREALPGCMRRDELVLGNRSRVSPGYWVATLGHYVGNFTAPLWGVQPHGKLVFFRSGEFYRIDETGRIDCAYILFDLLDLMRQAGRMPVPSVLGSDMLFPGPATHDGVLPAYPDRSDASASLVEAMLGDLRAYHPATFDSASQTGEGGYWHRDMLWYGPGGVGANFTYPGFQRDHRIPFLTAFPDRIGGNHFARFGDGDYVCSGGWPSMTMTHRGPYLGVQPTGRPLTLRVMDFWRVQAGMIRENWVLLDLPELLIQMGVDILA
jgi:predicted ester cyclase